MNRLIFEKTPNSNCKSYPIHNLKNFYVYNFKKEYLGEICFYAPWKKYVFSCIEDVVFDDSCLKEIVKKLEKLNKK